MPITVEETINAPVETVWTMWTLPNHILKWNHASDDWTVTNAINDLRAGGKFSIGMYARDGSAGFDFEGTYTNVVPNKVIEYSMSDGRTVRVTFETSGETTKVTETFDPEHENTPELQRAGWQSILTNFKTYVETNQK